MRDLEFNGNFWADKYKGITREYKRFLRHKKQILIAFFVITLGFIIKWGFTNVDRVVQGATAVTFEEANYKPFEIGPLIVDPPSVIDEVVIKDSMVNRRMQIMNFEITQDKVREILQSSSNICIHIKHFGVPQNVIFFSNLTMINPQVIHEGKERKNIQEVQLDGKTSWASRATHIYVKHYNEKLDFVHTALYGNQAYCFAFYGLN